MSEARRRTKALSVSPVKTSQTSGAAHAFMGIRGATPLMHGSQGCTAFSKVFFVRHFREPVPLQTTAMDQVSAVMGADDNLVEAVRVICEKHQPELVGVVTTGLAEIQGSDLRSGLARFRTEHPECADTAVVLVSSPDFSGCFQSGFALAVAAMVQALVPPTEGAEVAAPKRVNVLCGAGLTPGDLDFISESIESFGLEPMLLPDLGTSLDGHLDDALFSPLTTGRQSVARVRQMGASRATLVVGESMAVAADLLKQRTGVVDHRFGHLLGLSEVDRWFQTLSRISGQPVGARWQRQRSQYLDALLDTHFALSTARLAVAGDADVLLGLNRLFADVGSEVVAAVVPARSPGLEGIRRHGLQVGDLEDLESMARSERAQLLITNSHGVESARRLDLPLLRCGFPLYDTLGGFRRCWLGYQGSQQALFDAANLVLAEHVEIGAYRSVYEPLGDSASEPLAAQDRP